MANINQSRSARSWVLAPLGLAIAAACSSQSLPTSLPTTTPDIPIEYTFRIVNAFPHDPGAFTQGLAYEGGYLYEGTGQRGESTLRKVDLTTGRVAESIALDPELFGEGIALIDNRIIQLTLTSGLGFVYDRGTFSRLEEFSYTPEGWGLTYDGHQLIMSDGSPELRFLDPEVFNETSRIKVRDRGEPVQWLNELEYVEGEIFANVFQSNRIARISPATGEVLGWIDLSGLPGEETGLLNGIAYDAEAQRLFVTGKNWPWIFEIELVRK
ncbi:MAG: glutaminyl-peptide cyclotransferase [Anaerolineales bacterium]